MPIAPTGDFQQDFEETGPGTIGGRYLRTFWQPVAPAHDVLPGRAKPLKIMSEEMTLYRGKSGKPHLVGAKCAHRAAQLSAGWVEDDCIRCQYHGWKFDGSGQCVEQPGEEKGYAAKIRIPAYPVREHVGLLWAYMGEGEPPPFPPFPDFKDEGINEILCEVFPSNCLTDMENDNYHAFWTHKTSSLGIRSRGVSLEAAQTNAYNFNPSAVAETEFGVEQRLMGSVRGSNLYFAPGYFLILPGTGGPDWLLKRDPAHDLRTTLVNKLAIDDNSHYLMFSQRVRLKPEEVEPYMRLYEEYRKVRASCADPIQISRDLLDGKLVWSDVADYPLLIVVEDMVSQMGQGRIADRPTEHLGRTDNDLIFRRRVFERELKALHEGRPLKKWRPITDWNQVYYPDPAGREA